MKIQEKKKYTLRKMPPTTVFDRSVRRAEIRKQHKKGKYLDIKNNNNKNNIHIFKCLRKLSIKI